MQARKLVSLVSIFKTGRETEPAKRADAKSVPSFSAKLPTRQASQKSSSTPDGERHAHTRPSKTRGDLEENWAEF
jgi:hypothetical protein